MLYFHDMICLSPAGNAGIGSADRSALLHSVAGLMLKVEEPAYPGIPQNVMRRMGKCVRMCVGAAMPLVAQREIQGIIIGTANGGMEDCIKFLNQIIEYDEGKLTPGNFVQSTANGPAAQVALVTRNRHYNITHVHRGLAFEQALLDADLLLRDNPGQTILLGTVDEISAYNFNIDKLAGWYRAESKSNLDLFDARANGTLAGEGAVMMLVSGNQSGARAKLCDLQTIHSPDTRQVEELFQLFLSRNEVDLQVPMLLISGESGDDRFDLMNTMAERFLSSSTPVLRYKHLTGDYATANAFAVWLAAEIFSGYQPPDAMMKKGVIGNTVRRIIICNNYRGRQHSFLLLDRI